VISIRIAMNVAVRVLAPVMVPESVQIESVVESQAEAPGLVPVPGPFAVAFAAGFAVQFEIGFDREIQSEPVSLAEIGNVAEPVADHRDCVFAENNRVSPHVQSAVEAVHICLWVATAVYSDTNRWDYIYFEFAAVAMVPAVPAADVDALRQRTGMIGAGPLGVDGVAVVDWDYGDRGEWARDPQAVGSDCGFDHAAVR
jgi:hypothetical protein